jgi:hypothetical protein
MIRSEHKFTAVFDRDIRAFDGNPLKAETPFGVPETIAIGNVFEERDRLEAALEQIIAVCGDNAADTCNKAMALNFVRDVAELAIGR